MAGCGIKCHSPKQKFCITDIISRQFSKILKVDCDTLVDKRFLDIHPLGGGGGGDDNGGDDGNNESGCLLFFGRGNSRSAEINERAAKPVAHASKRAENGQVGNGQQYGGVAEDSDNKPE